MGYLINKALGRAIAMPERAENHGHQRLPTGNPNPLQAGYAQVDPLHENILPAAGHFTPALRYPVSRILDQVGSPVARRTAESGKVDASPDDLTGASELATLAAAERSQDREPSTSYQAQGRGYRPAVAIPGR